MTGERKKSKGPADGCCEGFPETFWSRGGPMNMKEMMRACPCATWMRRHRFAMFVTLALVGLTFLLLPAGWILGVVAFFRTI